MHAASVFTPPPGAVAVPCHVAEGPPGAGPTVPLEGFCARVPMSGMTQKRAMLLIRKSVPIVTRAVAEEELFFIIDLSVNATELGIERLANCGRLSSSATAQQKRRFIPHSSEETLDTTNADYVKTPPITSRWNSD